MILYFDNYITSQALNAGLPHWATKVREGESEIYKMPSKLEISLYSLASYAKLEWSKVIVKYSIEDKSKAEFFESEVKKLFPNAIIVRGRSDSPGKFMESVDLMRSFQDPWVFYAGNNDYPFVGIDAKTIGHCLSKAKELKETHKFVSIYLAPSFFGQGLSDKGSLAYDKRWERLGEDGSCSWSEVSGGYFDAIQVVHIDLFSHWFSQKSLEGRDARVFRSDSVENFVDVPHQVVVVPKKDICSHFDGMSHLIIHGYPNPDRLFPPLFIPPGFFEGKIKIAYGYGAYRPGWVNLNPEKENFSYEKKGGADMKIPPEEIPLFWKDRISKFYQNPGLDRKALESALLKLKQMQQEYLCFSLAKKSSMLANRAAWIATRGLPIWASRLKSWNRNPDSLKKVLDERDRGVGGKAKQAAKKAFYSVLSALKKGNNE